MYAILSIEIKSYQVDLHGINYTFYCNQSHLGNKTIRPHAEQYTAL